MYNKKSDYAQNKKNRNLIVYNSVTKNIVLSENDFESHEVFEQWKAWSDMDYRQTESIGRSFYDNSILTDQIEYIAGHESSIEELLIKHDEEYKYEKFQLYFFQKLKEILTEKQYRRMWMHYAEGKTLEEIGGIEGVAFQNVAESITRGKRKAVKWFIKNKDRLI